MFGQKNVSKKMWPKKCWSKIILAQKKCGSKKKLPAKIWVKIFFGHKKMWVKKILTEKNMSQRAGQKGQ